MGWLKCLVCSAAADIDVVVDGSDSDDHADDIISAEVE
jgi:hypothetical protein